MPNHLEEASNGYNWNAVLNVPTELRGVNGLPSLRFKKSTGTADKRKACTIASQYVAGWKLLIEKAKGNDTGFLVEAMRFKDDIEKAKDAEYREALESVLIDHAERIEKTHKLPKAKQFVDMALGITTPTSLHFDSWKVQLQQVAKSRDQMSRDVAEFIKVFPTTKDIQHIPIRDWLEKLEAEGKTYSHRKRVRANARDFWKYLVRRKVIADKTDPFIDALPVIRRKKGAKQNNWLPYKPAEVVEFWRKAKEREKHALADLIVLAAYTGARREELGKLKLENVGEKSFHIVDSKTAAGIREVPIHSAITPLIKRLRDTSTDGYLLSGLSSTKYNARTNALGTTFGRMKQSMGFSERHSFHSLRSTTITLLENAGVPENLAADIVGHDKPRMTYGLYSDGNELEIKRVAIEKVSYPFPELF